MAGIYIHIPFCKKACHYCDFHFSTSLQRMPELINAIRKEAALQHHYLSEAIATLYFGGGTPSLLTTDQLTGIVNTIRGLYMIDTTAEITLEANPDDITAEKTAGWKEAGINRLSIGIQSFFEEDLIWMNRAHNAQQALDAVATAQQSGFDNISIDLIYGTPLLTDDQWIQNLETAIASGVPHVSCYALTVEPKTALAKMIATRQTENTDPDKQARHFSILMEWMDKAGYEQYEISNFAKPGFRSRHNSSYWQGKNYLGLGPSAHSFNGTSRQWNVASNALYLTSLANGILPFESETLDERQQFNEYIMTSLRTTEGISLEKVNSQWGAAVAENLVQLAQVHLTRAHIVQSGNHLQLNNTGKFLADGIAADLFRLY